MKLKYVLGTVAGIAVGVAVPAAIITIVSGGATLSGPVIMHTLKQIGRGSAKAGLVTLGASGGVSGTLASVSTMSALDEVDDTSMEVQYE